MNAHNFTIDDARDDAREGDRNASAHEPQSPAVPQPQAETTGAAPGSRHAVFDINHQKYIDAAVAMGYEQKRNGDWRHHGLGFDVAALRHSWMRIDRYHTLQALRECYYVQAAAARGRRIFVGAVAVLVVLAFIIALLVWPTRGNAQAHADATPLAGNATAAACTHSYRLAPGELRTWQCFHAYVPARMRVGVESGNANVLASVAFQNTSNNPQYVQVVLYNPSKKVRTGSAFVELWLP